MNRQKLARLMKKMSLLSTFIAFSLGAIAFVLTKEKFYVYTSLIWIMVFYVITKMRI